MITIGLIAAMPLEGKALLDKVKAVARLRQNNYSLFRFSIGANDCILVVSGMGVARAEAATRWLLHTYHPDCLISFGIAGAVQADLRIGDVVLAARNSRLEGGALTPLLPLAEPSNEAWETVVRKLGLEQIRAMRGSAITTRGSQISACPPGWEHPILEMETAGILKAVEDSPVPLISLRSISDGPGDPIPLDLGEAMGENGNLRMGELFRTVLKHPGILLKAGPMMKNSRIAADHAAQAVLALLEQGGKSTIPLKET